MSHSVPFFLMGGMEKPAPFAVLIRHGACSARSRSVCMDRIQAASAESGWTLWMAVLFLLGGTRCAKDDNSLTGVQCGTGRCARGQVCCVDCDGTGTCLAPGNSCPGLRCLPRDAGADRGYDGGGADSGTGIRCDDTVCQAGMVCCIACDGRGTCGAPGLVCPATGCGVDAGNPAACTPEGQGVHGTTLTVNERYLAANCLPSTRRLLTSAEDVRDAFPAGNAPPEVQNADFTRDRVLLWSSNPRIEFVVDDGQELVAGEEMFCQGAAPWCMAHIIQGTTRNTLRMVECPYKGPNPCLAP